MNYLIFTATAVTFLVLLSWAVEQLLATYDDAIEARIAELNKLDALMWEGE